MSCSHPIPALDLGLDPVTFKRRIKIKYPKVNESLADFKRKYPSCVKVLLLPCGHCISCRLAKRREWALRAALEAKYYQDISFVTLTYDNQHNDGKLHKDHLQQFIKAVRNRGYNVRYFGCGEFGSEGGRPHYHIILFGYFPKDAMKDFNSNTDYACYRSDEINSCWNRGLAVVQYFDASVAGYVAGYTDKKITNEDGFLIMSKRPGLGYQYLEDHKDEIAEYLKITDDLGNIKGGQPPRYFSKLCEENWNILLDEKKSHNAEIQRIIKAMKMQRYGLYREEDLMKRTEFFDYRKAAKLKRC